MILFAGLAEPYPLRQGEANRIDAVQARAASGVADAELLADFPQLVHEDVPAAITYGAEAAHGQDWAWLDSIAGKLDKDFVRAINEQPEQQQRPALENCSALLAS